MDDLSRAVEFVHSINIDGRFEGERVALSGYFLKQETEGVATLAHSRYQFVVNEALALVAVVPESYSLQEGCRYCITGRLVGAGEAGMFPGIEIESLRVS